MIRQFFTDDAGELSCMRLLIMCVLCVVLGMWVWGMLRAGQYIPLGYAEAGLITSAIAGKAAQARFEYGGFPAARGSYGAGGGDSPPAPPLPNIRSPPAVAGTDAVPPAPSPRNLEEEEEP